MTTPLNRKPARQGLVASVLGRMSASETLISDRHTESMLVGLLVEAEKVEDGDAIYEIVRGDMASAWGVDESDVENRKPFLYRDGVAIIPVHGILINRFSYCWGFVTGYEFIRKQMNAAAADPDVSLIVFDHDTPGGEAAGCDELAREISELEKPTLGVVNTLSASGGYWLLAPCDRAVCAPSGTIGSIGVYILHMNVAKALAEWGIEVDYVQAGEYKTSGSPYRELSAQDREYLQGMVDERYDEFVKAVAEYRGIEEGVARGTEARVMRPTEAISLGLIDAAVAPSKAVADYLAELGGGDPEHDQEDERIMADQEMSSEDRANERKAEQARIKGIMTSEEAKGREAQAEHLAYETELSVEAATAILASGAKAEAEEPESKETDNSGAADEGSTKDDGTKDTDKEKKDGDDTQPSTESEDKAKGKSHFENAMDSQDQPNIGPNGGSNDGTDGKSKVNNILAAQAAATGIDRRAKA